MAVDSNAQQEEGWCPFASPYVVAVSVMLATFMEVLDTTIVNVSLPHIAGSMSAGVDEVTWVVTSYLVSNAIVLPATGWFSRVFGRKRFYMFCVVMFTVSSFLCGLAPSLGWLVALRVLQGLGGGALQPISQAILLESFPLRKRGIGMAIFGIGVVFAPIIGPTLGGWITDNYTWRWIFYINIPVGILSLTLTEMFIADPPYLRRGVERVDYTGLGLLAVGIGCLQIVLDNGERHDWFETSWITQLSVLAVACLIALILWERHTAHPIIDLRVFSFRNYSPSIVIMFVLGVALYGSLVLLPIFLQNLLGYTAMLSGLALSPGGIGTLVCMPFVGYLVGRRDARYLVIFGLVVVSASMFMMARYNLYISFWDAVYPRIVMGVGLAFLFVPIATVAFAFTPQEHTGSATGIFNLMRNLGGSFGIAFVTTLLARRAQFHQVRLIEHISAGNPVFQQAFHNATLKISAAGSGPVLAQKKALGLFYGTVIRQSTGFAFIDCFWIVGVMILLMIPLLFIMRRPPRHTEPGPAAH